MSLFMTFNSKVVFTICMNILLLLLLLLLLLCEDSLKEVCLVFVLCNTLKNSCVYGAVRIVFLCVCRRKLVLKRPNYSSDGQLLTPHRGKWV